MSFQLPEVVQLHCPAKINLMLSVHGPRADGFHALTSVVVPLDFGDTLMVRRTVASEDSLICSDQSVPLGDENLILKAAGIFRKYAGSNAFFEFDLTKRIPMGAGLGGGSSDAAIALLAMNQLSARPLSKETLKTAASELGSDCAFFIDRQPALMRGRGELVDPLDIVWQRRLEGQRVALFKPSFSVPTAWAFGELKRGEGRFYESESKAIERLDKSEKIDDLLFNSFEDAVGRKYLVLPTLLEKLRHLGFEVLLSGSGSCCFALIPDRENACNELKENVREALGDNSFWVETFVIRLEASESEEISP